MGDSPDGDDDDDGGVGDGDEDGHESPSYDSDDEASAAPPETPLAAPVKDERVGAEEQPAPSSARGKATKSAVRSPSARGHV